MNFCYMFFIARLMKPRQVFENSISRLLNGREHIAPSTLSSQSPSPRFHGFLLNTFFASPSTVSRHALRSLRESSPFRFRNPVLTEEFKTYLASVTKPASPSGGDI
jgi:hypothetical protein